MLDPPSSLYSNVVDSGYGLTFNKKILKAVMTLILIGNDLWRAQ